MSCNDELKSINASEESEIESLIAKPVSLKEPIATLFFFHSSIYDPDSSGKNAELVQSNDGKDVPPSKSNMDEDFVRSIVQRFRFVGIELSDAGKTILLKVDNIGELTEAELKIWLGNELRKLNQEYRLNLDWFTHVYTFDADKVDSVNLYLWEFFEEETIQAAISSQKEMCGSWSQIWAFGCFSAYLLSIYANISYQDAVDFLQLLEELGYVQLEQYIEYSTPSHPRLVRVKSHLFLPHAKLRTYLPPSPTVSPALIGTNFKTQERSNFFAACQRAWVSVRILGRFRISDIQITANVSKLLGRVLKPKAKAGWKQG